MQANWNAVGPQGDRFFSFGTDEVLANGASGGHLDEAGAALFEVKKYARDRINRGIMSGEQEDCRKHNKRTNTLDH